MEATQRIAVIGLGYVGLPLAVALARRHDVTGFDINASHVTAILAGHDRAREVDFETLKQSTLKATSDSQDIAGFDIYIVAVPTPVDIANRPDLGPVLAASRTVGKAMAKGAIVVFESTVYPGVTEEICGPALERASGLVCGRDFFLGYSPERINPGDREHTVERITKVVAGQTPAVAKKLAEIYGSLNGGNTFIAHDIKTAEAAKVIENAQRDINIAFINEVTMIFHRLGISMHQVLAAARTKWNFLPFSPGLVGGHCIGVDPFWLADRAQQVGHHPDVILAGRRINDSMAAYIATAIARMLAEAGCGGGARILVLGLTFKENVPDLRNSKVVDLIKDLRTWGHDIDVHDALAEADDASRHYGIELLPSIEKNAPYDAVIGAVAHDSYRALDAAGLARLLKPRALVADIKGMWSHLPLPEGCRRFQL